jgi:hypothetical protein
LLSSCGEAACFSGFAWAFGSLLDSNPSIGVVLIFLLLDCVKWADLQVFLMWTAAKSKNRRSAAYALSSLKTVQ